MLRYQSEIDVVRKLTAMYLKRDAHVVKAIGSREKSELDTLVGAREGTRGPGVLPNEASPWGQLQTHVCTSPLSDH